MISMKPKMISGMPTIDPTTVTVRITPAIIKTNPRMAPTNLPVASMIHTTNFQINQNGYSIQ